MVFTSFVFFLFLPIVFVLYWFVFAKKLQAQNLLILAASYFFYGWWDWRFLGLIAFSTLLDFTISRAMGKTDLEKVQRRLLWLSMAGNLSVLGFFKYYNFFVTSWVESWASLGIQMDSFTLKIVLPVGISFYTFQSMSYSLDVYQGRLKPTNNLISYAAFVSFFPQLVAGPIERAIKFLPQVEHARTFDQRLAANGLRLMLWGLFKKVVIADNLAVYVDAIFQGYPSASALTLILGAVYFSIQIYCDFSGYSDIAIGVASLFGFELMSNFKFPLFSKSIPELWSRWHISLTTWLNDYVFTPISLSLRQYRRWGIGAAILLTFLVSGLWHGAKWTFVLWGLINGLLFIPYVIKGKILARPEYISAGRWLPTVPDFLRMLMIFSIWTLTLVLFRADDMGMALGYFQGMATHWSGPLMYKTGLAYVLGLLLLDWLNRRDERNPIVLRWGPLPVRMGIQIVLAIVIFFNMLSGYKEFVYFDF
jgi:alginate O-acetyltransferase complex protein AlgI